MREEEERGEDMIGYGRQLGARVGLVGQSSDPARQVQYGFFFRKESPERDDLRKL
jgi:hypothetical protein